METTTVQVVHIKVDPVQELPELCKENIAGWAGQSLNKTVLDYCDIFAQHDNDLGRTSSTRLILEIIYQSNRLQG